MEQISMQNRIIHLFTNGSSLLASNNARELTRLIAKMELINKTVRETQYHFNEELIKLAYVSLIRSQNEVNDLKDSFQVNKELNG